MKKIREREKKKKKKKEKGRVGGKDGSPASTANRTSSVIAAGRPHRNSSSDRLFTYLPWPTEPQGSRINTDKCCV